MTSPLKFLLAASLSVSALVASAKPSVLSLTTTVNDSTIIYPESVETDVNKMMENWYLQNYTALDEKVDSRPDVQTTDREIIDRLKAIPTVIELPYNSIVRAYINMYTGKKRSLVETMLGMSLYYMPIFEQALEREGIPNELKYLPVIESALDPNAVSKAGATGLWQIMLPTARGLGLEINTLVDERRDPVTSSEAAAKYLHQLYDIYKDWSLAIAAYNCGPGNVNKALRRCTEEKKDFWAIYPFLPAETRGYVPCFIAATYVMNNYAHHNISPALAKRPILTDSVHVNHRVHFNQISELLHIPVEELEILNPQYRQKVIPGDIRPYALVLPANQTYAYIMSEDAIARGSEELYGRRETVEPASLDSPSASYDGQEGEWVTTEQVKWHKVAKGETMTTIARKYGITLAALKQANGGIRKPRRGQKLKVVTTQRVFKPKETAPAADDALLVKNPTPADDSETGDTAELTAQSDSTATPMAADSISAALTDNTTSAPAATATATEASAPATETVQSPTTDKVTKSFTESKKKQQQAAAAKPATTAKKEAPATYKVKKGDTLSKIAKRNGTTVAKLRKLNGLKDDRINIGDKIKLK